MGERGWESDRVMLREGSGVADKVGWEGEGWEDGEGIGGAVAVPLPSPLLLLAGVNVRVPVPPLLPLQDTVPCDAVE